MRRKLGNFLGTLIAVALAAGIPTFVVAQTNVPKWSVHEITLTASGSISNPYTEASVIATFKGPGGVEKSVSGFWDGSSAFRVRFTPTSEGIWSWSTSSSNAGLNGKSGTINCTRPLAGKRGFPRRDANNRTSFVWDDGTRYFMWGQTYYDVMLNVIANGGWKTAVDSSLAHGMNKIRLHVYASKTYTSQAYVKEYTTYPQVIPYGKTYDSPNRDELNISYWQGLDVYVKHLESKGVIADLILFNSYVDLAGVRMWGTQAQDERYLRYILARYAAFPNVIWCIVNEWAMSKKAQSYFDTLGTIVRNEDRWMEEGSFLRPLSVHQNTRIDFQFFGSSWPVHAIFQYGVRNKETDATNEFRNTARTKYNNGDEWGNAGIVYNLGRNMPVVNDEYGYIGETSPISLTQSQHRRAIWGIAAAGGYGAAGDIRRTSTGNPEISGDWLDAPEYSDIKRLVDFFTTKGLSYWKMSSQNSLKTSGTRVYVLAQTGRQYVIYAAVGGAFSVDIDSGLYSARRYNPSTGEDVVLSDVSGGGSRSFTMPDSNDWVVYLKAKATGQRAASLR